MNVTLLGEARPPQQAPLIRIRQLDVLRGLAVLGIYWINIAVFALPSASYALPTLAGQAGQANSLVWAFSQLFVEGTMRGLFSMLFGASAMVFLSEARLAENGVALVDRYYRRTLLLVAFGLLHAYVLLWPYDVLYVYGLIGMLLFPLRRLRVGLLLLLGCLLLVVGDLDPFEPGLGDEAKLEAVATDVGASLREAAKAAGTLEGVDANDIVQETVNLQDETERERYLAGYPAIFRSQVDTVVEMQSRYLYTTYVYDVGGMMLIGMALLKLGVLAGMRSRRYYLGLMLSGYLVGGLLRGVAVVDTLTAVDIVGTLQGFSLGYNLGRLPMTLGHIGLIGLLCSSQRFARVTDVLARVGRLALSNYILQTLLSIFVFYGFGLGLFGALERYQLALLCLGVWAVQIVLSLAWLRLFYQGPLEWLWRSLIYGRRQPLRRISS